MRLLVAWYGTFPKHGTLGDWRALQTLVLHLVSVGHEVTHASSWEWDVTGAQRACWPDIDVELFDAVLFVCGPIISWHSNTQAFFEWSKRRPLIGVAVSLFAPNHENYVNPFDFVLAREGTAARFGDLAVLAPPVVTPSAAEQLRVGLVLRGPQSEYGDANCMWREAETAFRAGLDAIAQQVQISSVLEIENHLGQAGLGPDDIERQYASCRVILTTRFHGAIEALRCGRPFIAIDHIRGGAKLSTLLGPLGWPHVYQAASIDTQVIRAALLDILSGASVHEEIDIVRERAVNEARHTLARLDAILADIALNVS